FCCPARVPAVVEASTVCEPRLHRTAYLVTEVRLPSAASHRTVARPCGPWPSPSLGIEAETPVGAEGFAHGVTALDFVEGPSPLPTELTPLEVKVCFVYRSRSRDVAEVFAASTVFASPGEAVTT